MYSACMLGTWAETKGHVNIKGWSWEYSKGLGRRRLLKRSVGELSSNLKRVFVVSDLGPLLTRTRERENLACGPKY